MDSWIWSASCSPCETSVVRSFGHWRSAEQLDRLGGDAWCVPGKIEAKDVLPTCALGGPAVAARVGAALHLAAVDGDDRQAGAALGALLRARRSLTGGKRRAHPAAGAVRLRARDARVAAQRALGGEQQRELVLQRDRERILLPRPAPMADGGRGGRERPRRCRGLALGDPEGAAEGAIGACPGRVARCREAPPAADAHPHADAREVLALDLVDAAVADEDVLAVRLHVPDLGVRAAIGRRAHGVDEHVQH